MILGAEEVIVRHNNDWWFISSNTDWFEGMDIDILFRQIIPMPK
jgi:hypothetical protein